MGAGEARVGITHHKNTPYIPDGIVVPSISQATQTLLEDPRNVPPPLGSLSLPFPARQLLLALHPVLNPLSVFVGEP